MDLMNKAYVNTNTFAFDGFVCVIIMCIIWSFSSQFNQIFGIHFIDLYYHIHIEGSR